MIQRRLPTGWRALDELLGGGLPAGGVVALSGPEGVGKTALALEIAAGMRGDGAVALLDTDRGSRICRPALEGGRLAGALAAVAPSPGRAWGVAHSLLLAGVRLLVIDAVSESEEPPSRLLAELRELHFACALGEGCALLVVREEHLPPPQSALALGVSLRLRLSAPLANERWLQVSAPGSPRLRWRASRSSSAPADRSPPFAGPGDGGLFRSVGAPGGAWRAIPPPASPR